MLVPVVVLSLPFLYLLVRKPVLRRLAVRNALRRPRETALVLLGSLLGTAIITGSFVVGDTLEASFRQAAYSHQGPIDELVIATGPAIPVVAQRLAALRSPDVDGQVPITTADASFLSTGAPPKAEPHGLVVEVDFAAARDFGGDPDATGISGATPAPGHAVLGEDAARTLGIAPGGKVVVSTFGRRLELVVDRIIERKGVAGFRFGPSTDAPDVFVTPGTLAPLAAAAPPGAPPPSVMIAVSNTGGVIDGAQRTAAVAQQIKTVLGDAPARVLELKQDTLDEARDNGKQFTQLFGSIGFFSVLAGVLLLVNIFVMLAQERKTELGMLRAVGLRRASLVGSFSLEGWLYALASSFLGMFAGLAVGKLIVFVAAGIFSNPGDSFNLELRYAAKLPTVLAGFGFGFFISLLTVVLTSLSIARLNVIRAIRDLPEPPRSARQNLGFAVLGAALIAVSVPIFASGVSSKAAAAVLFGPALAGVGVVLLLRRWVAHRPLATAVSAFVLGFSIFGFQLFPDVFEDAEITVFVVLGVVLTGSAVALVSLNQDVIGLTLRRMGGGSRNMALRLGLAYPLARRFRTGMILAMYTLVVFTLVFMTTFSYLFAQQVDEFRAKISGQFDVAVDTNASSPIAVADLKSVAGVEDASVISSAPAQFQELCPRCSKEFKNWQVSSADEAFARIGAPKLNERLPEYPDDATAYRALATDPNAFIPSRFFLQNGGGPPGRLVKPGETVVLKDPESGRTRELRVIGTAESDYPYLLALVSPSVMADMFGSRAAPNLLWASVRSDADPDAVAAAVNGRFIANGADARSFREIVNDNLSQQQQFFRLIQGYLALGLVVGIAGLGVVMVRAVRERRRQVGVLRALGFESAAVRRAFVTESAFVAFEGIVIGTSLALVTAWRLVANDTFGDKLPFSVPVAELALLTIGTFLASLIATAAPAQQASRIKPAVALRIAD